MAFDSVADFIAMGGYGFFVWLSYGISALSIAIYIGYVKYESKQIVNNVIAQQKRETRIAQAKAKASAQTDSRPLSLEEGS